MDGSDPVDNYHAIRGELEQHSQVLAEKQEVVVANKNDLDPEGKQLAHVKDMLGPNIPAISAATGQGIKELKELLWQRVKELKA